MAAAYVVAEAGGMGLGMLVPQNELHLGEMREFVASLRTAICHMVIWMKAIDDTRKDEQREEDRRHTMRHITSHDFH